MKTSVVRVPADIRTGHLLNTSLEHYRYTNLLSLYQHSNIQTIAFDHHAN